MALRPAVFDRDVLSLDIACIAQPLVERGHNGRIRAGRGAAEVADYRHRLLLGAHGKRPRNRRAAQEQLAASYMSGKEDLEGRRGVGHEPA
jgi:hypothetical protein